MAKKTVKITKTKPRRKARSEDARSATDVDRHFARKLREARIASGMSQQTLSELIGVTFQQIQKYENGANRMAASRLLHIARALGVPVSYFFDGA